VPPLPNSLSLANLIRQLPNFDCLAELSALEEESIHGLRLLEAVIEKGFLAKEVACKLYADELGIAYVDPFASLITEEAVLAIPAEIAKKIGVIGLYIIDGVLTAAFSTPEDASLVKRLSLIIKMPVSPIFSLPRDIDDTILIQYSNEKDLKDDLNELSGSTVFNNPEQAESESLVKTFDDIIYYAIRERATDIHIEAQEGRCRVRLRIDGMLREVLTYSRKLHRAIIARIKILSNLNIAETRFPQDGRFSMPIGYSTANFRVSTIPAQYGEKSVIRILAMSGKKSMITLDKMMMSQTILSPFRRLIQNPNGILFVTGPTGSGKTTTLYAALNEINSPEKNISTIEDPIEMQVEGITQTQVNSHIDLRFATVLRSLLRQDPDAILIGEIRDLETAKIATEAALTGHIVFATLHTNSAAQAIVRLIEIGVAPYMVAPSIIGVLAQRLAARICDNCKEPYYPSRELLQKYFKEEGLTDVPFFRGRGCRACRGTGYKGRVAFHELVLITDEIRTLITNGASVQQITTAAAKVGFKPLRYDGLKKVLLGLTTIDEIEANTSFEWET
jgi:type II secretory ATPase GspE/PulE/Tfp pilus assembly ATPase PilB-like protein